MPSKIPKKVNWKKRFWKIFSEYIRRRDRGRCVTCGDQRGWKDQDAGHFIRAGVSPPPLYFNVKNVNCQCTRCNITLNGNEAFHAIYLVGKYGDGVLQELEALRRAGGKWSSWTYAVLCDEYKKKIEEVKNNA